jgi:uncharacterized protein (TIGR03118 family)
MKSLRIPIVAAGIAGALTFALSSPSRVTLTAFEKSDLLSDGVLPTPNVNTNLVNPWGLASSPTGPFWIASEGTGTSQIVRADGSAFAPDVLVPGDQSGHPTGLVFNGEGGFDVQSGGARATSLFLFVTLDGRILGWNPTLDPATAIVSSSHARAGAAYTGAAIASSGGQRFLYVANFAGGTVDVFDEAFAEVESFSTRNVPANYAPFGIANVDGMLLVTFALRDPSTGEDVPGPGNGYVFRLSPDGSVFEPMISRGELDAPWGLVVAPGGFGKFSQKLLVGNFGDGRILAYNPHNGNFVGQMEDEEGEPIVIEGIWGLLFGNGGEGGDPRDLYFTAGIDDEEHGLFGEIEVAH